MRELKLERRTFMSVFGAGALVAALPKHAWTQSSDTLRLAIGHHGNWDTSVLELGQRTGIFDKHGLKLELLYTQGGGETQQAMLSGSVDLSVAAGIRGALSAFPKGAPVRILGAETTGAGDLF